MADEDDNTVARRMRSRYTPTDESWIVPPPQRYGTPRPGHGTVYLHLGHDTTREHGLVTVAEWHDAFPQPDRNGALFGHDVIQGSRDEVLAWVRSRPADAFLMFSREQEDWVPLPADDDQIIIG